MTDRSITDKLISDKLRSAGAEKLFSSNPDDVIDANYWTSLKTQDPGAEPGSSHVEVYVGATVMSRSNIMGLDLSLMGRRVYGITASFIVATGVDRDLALAANSMAAMLERLDQNSK